MISIGSSTLVSCCYTPEGSADNLSTKDKRIYAIPGMLAYLDIIIGLALIIIGTLASHNIIGISGASYFIGFGSAQLSIGLFIKLLPISGVGQCFLKSVCLQHLFHSLRPEKLE